MKLSKRLTACAEMVEGRNTVIDVGCDHALLPIHLVRSGRAARALACDIRQGPLDSAKRNISGFGLEGKITTLLTDGLDGVTAAEEGDAVLLCGMGAENIIEILKRAGWTKNGVHLIMQPQTRAYKLREFLYKNGYRITDEKLCLDFGKLYVAIKAQGGCSDCNNPLFTPYIENDPYFEAYLAMLRKKFEKASLGSGEEGAKAGKYLALLKEYRR